MCKVSLSGAIVVDLGHPNIKMIQRPIFSTWARYSRDVNEEVVLEFAQEMADHGYSDIQFELDDYWEVSRFSQTNAEAKTANCRTAMVRWSSIQLDFPI